MALQAVLQVAVLDRRPYRSEHGKRGSARRSVAGASLITSNIRCPNGSAVSAAFIDWWAPRLCSGICPGLRALEEVTHQVQPAWFTQNIQRATMAKCWHQFQPPLAK